MIPYRQHLPATNRKYTRMIIRTAEATDAPALSTVAKTVFAATYGAVIPSAVLHRYLTQTFSETALLADLANPSHAYWVAIAEDQLVGFSQLTRTPPPACVPVTPAIELARFYILPTHQGRGVAGPLLAAIQTAAQQMGYRAVWLCVWEANDRALAFYRKWGFVPVGRHDIVVEDIVFHDYILIKQLEAG